MILDGIDLGIGKIVIADSVAVINGAKIPTNYVDIYSKDNSCVFTFWTKQEYKKYNNLELNKKTDVLNLIDDYDIDFCTEEFKTINSRENTKVYFTRIDNNKYIINAEINDFDSSLTIGNIKNHKKLTLEAIIDFNTIKKEIDLN